MPITFDCRGCRVPEDTSKQYRLIKVGMECKSKDVTLGNHKTLDGCAAACAAREGCKYFIYGHAINKQRCYEEKTLNQDCPEGWEVDMYDFYMLRHTASQASEEVVTGPAGISLENLTHTQGSLGLYQYTPATETFDIDKWQPGLFTALLNAKTFGFKNGWNGTSDEKPASKWGSRSLQPCIGVGFARNEGQSSNCRDPKTDERAKKNLLPRTIDWCSKDWKDADYPIRRTTWQ